MRASIPLSCCLAVSACIGQEVVWRDPSPHTVRFVSVDSNVQLEVLDWGGSGRPLVLLAGLGNTAHIFDEFAPKLTTAYHVFGITRRGFGASSSPPSGYSADRLADDVLEVLNSLKIERPVLVGHSIAGEELSSVATRLPERISGLIYLDAAYAPAYYDHTRGDLDIDTIYLQRELRELQAKSPGSRIPVADMQKKLDRLEAFDSTLDPKWGPFVQELLTADLPGFETTLRKHQPAGDQTLITELLQTDLPGLRRDLKQALADASELPPQEKPPSPTGDEAKAFAGFRSWEMRVRGFATPEEEMHQQYESGPQGKIGKPRPYMRSPRVYREITMGVQRYTDIRVPVLAIYAPKSDPGQKAQQKAFAIGVARSQVVLLPKAAHHVFLSNEADVLREMKVFLDGLK